MIKQLTVVGDGVELGADIQKYINRKISKLDRYIPRHARKSVHGEVRMRDNTGKSTQSNDKYECEVVLHLPHQQVLAKEATLNMFAAVDIVETKLRNQLRRHKEQNITQRRVKRERVIETLRRLSVSGRK